MPVLPKKKVGIISCSGEEFPEGTVARMATLRVLEKLRPNDTVTLCLPLFLAGNDKERAFGRFYPTIAIDGCDKRCAARATEKYSAKPTASIVIPEFLAERHLNPPRSCRRLDADGEIAADALAQEIARRVDEILGVKQDPALRSESSSVKENETIVAACSCGSGIPVMRLEISGKPTELIALPLLFEQWRTEKKPMEELFAAVKIYNAIPADLESEYRAVILQAYTDYQS
jgi:uncharacterized metal-binding protein